MSANAQPSGEKASLLSNILAIVGLIILVIIIVWGLVHLAELSSGWFTSLFGQSGPTIKVTAPADATSGAPTTVSWDYSTTAAGSYAFLYQCQSNSQFAIVDTAKNTASGIPCGAAFNVTPANKSIVILPLTSATTSVKVPFSIIFIPTSGSQVQGTATLTIHPGSATATAQPSQTVTQPTKTVTTTTTKPVTTTYKAPRTYSPADISVRIIAQSVDQYGNATVTFNISNIGGSRSGAYYFSAQMPTQTPTPYTSSLQAPLGAGSYIVNTLRFSQAVSGTFSVSVSAQDRNQGNNYASQWINAPVNNYNYGSSYNTYNPYTNYNQYTGPNGNYTQYQTYPYTY